MVKENSDNLYESQRLNIFSVRKTDHLLLTLDGELTIYTVKALKEKLLQALNATTALVLNLSKVNEMDSAGFQVLLLIKREAQTWKKKLRYISHSPVVLSVLDLYGAVGLFGDQIVIPSETRKNYYFNYGLKKQKLFP